MVRISLFVFNFIMMFNLCLAENDSIDCYPIDSENRPFNYLEAMPAFKGNLLKFIQKNIRYRDFSNSEKINGRVLILCCVDTAGNTQNHKVYVGMCKEVDENGMYKQYNDEALRVARLVKFETPAMQRGKPVVTWYSIPVDFKFSKKKGKRKKCLF